MDERSSRIFLGLCLLVLVWIGVYWMWQPTREQQPVITFDSTMAPPKDPISTDKPAQPAPVEIPSPEPDIVQPRASEPQPKEQASTPKLIPPEFVEHTVVQGELMQTIAQRYFGSIDDWTIIAKANPRVDPRKLKPGMVLRVPKDKHNIQGRLEGVEQTPGVIVSHTGEATKHVEYIVRSGDSLSLIAQRIYGSSIHANFIFEANRDVLRSMDSISIGQLLRLPPLPEEPGQSQSDG